MTPLRYVSLSGFGDLEITRKKMDCMRDGQWLNDEVRTFAAWGMTQLSRRLNCCAGHQLLFGAASAPSAGEGWRRAARAFPQHILLQQAIS
jgi:hypothetical protein